MTNEAKYKYNYVFYTVDEGALGGAMFASLKVLDNVVIPPHNFLLEQKIPSVYPLKRSVFRKMYDAYSFDNKLPICFVFVGGIYALYENGYVDYIKGRDKRNRIVCIIQDIMERKLSRPYMKNFDTAKHKIDLFTTYDKSDAAKYDFLYVPEFFYEPQIEVTEPDNFDVDLLFLGRKKDRLEQLQEIASYLSGQNARCDFIIMEVSENERVPIKGVTYSDEYISYREYLKKIQQSRCLLEVTQTGSIAHTLRANEAVVFRRKLLTDRKIAPDDYFSCDAQVRTITGVSDIDLDFLLSENNYTEFLRPNWRNKDRLRLLEEYL